VRLTTRAFGDVAVHVRVAGREPGTAPPLLLVHGFMTSGYSWRYVLDALGRDFTLYVPDLIGAGRSDKPDGDYHPDHLADSLGLLIDALAIRGTAVIGNSLGGYLCMRLALRDAGAMSRLVNLHSPGLATARNCVLSVAMKVVPFTEAVVRELVWRDPERWVHKNVHYFDETLKSREEHREYARPLREPAGVRAFHHMLRDTLAARAMDTFAATLEALEARGESFPIPLQLVYAKADPMVPPSVGRRLRDLIPDAQWVELERGSHFAHVDAPELFLAAVRPFLGVVDPAVGPS